MQSVGVNMTNVKQINRANVLRLLLAHPAMSRTDMAAALHLTTATLTAICNDFLQRGLLVEAEQVDDTTSIGRRKCPLRINPTYKYVIAVNIHYTGSTIAITDLQGNAIAAELFLYENHTDAREFLHQVANICIRLLWDSKLDQKSVLGVGVCIVGAVDNINGVALNPFRIFDQHAVPIREILEEELSFPVYVENNMCAFLTAENLFCSSPEHHTMLIKWGPGVGSASAVDGKICKNKEFHSMEVGHTFSFFDRKLLCWCGRTGCLERGICLDAFSDKIEELLPDFPALQAIQQQYGKPSIRNILHYLEADCPALYHFAMECAEKLAIGISNAAQVFSPDRIALYGAFFEAKHIHDTFLEKLSTIDPALKTICTPSRSLRASNEYIGPAAIAIETFLVETGGESIAMDLERGGHYRFL